MVDSPWKRNFYIFAKSHFGDMLESYPHHVEIKLNREGPSEQVDWLVERELFNQHYRFLCIPRRWALFCFKDATHALHFKMRWHDYG